jgi:hypothetical protein
MADQKQDESGIETETKITVGFNIKGKPADNWTMPKTIIGPDDKCTMCGKPRLEHSDEDVRTCAVRKR